jgi:hypothetical protein
MKTTIYIITMGILSLLFGCKRTSPYHQKNGEWFFKDEKIILSGDGNLIPIDDLFAKDKQTAYYRGAQIEGSSANSFVSLNEYYAKDKMSVFFCDTYRMGQEYFLNKHVRIIRLKDADPTSFVALKDGYAKDQHTVYVMGVVLVQADTHSFKVLDFGFSSDKKHAFYDLKPIEGSDGSTFEVLESDYAKDKLNVYYSTLLGDDNGNHIVLIKGADPLTFKVIGSGYAADIHTVFYQGKRINANPITFKLVEYKEWDATSDNFRFLKGEKYSK